MTQNIHPHYRRRLQSAKGFKISLEKFRNSRNLSRDGPQARHQKTKLATGRKQQVSRRRQQVVLIISGWCLEGLN